MSQSLSSLNFDGQMRTDANHAGNKQYTPNSFAHKFRPDTAEAPYAVSDNIVSRKSHYWHEGKKSDYEQATVLWSKTMTEQQRKNTASNTAKLLSKVNFPVIQKKYLAQIYNIAVDYSKSVYDLLSKKEFEFREVEELSKTAQEWYKEKKFQPTNGERLTGYAPPTSIYNV